MQFYMGSVNWNATDWFRRTTSVNNRWISLTRPHICLKLKRIVCETWEELRVFGNSERWRPQHTKSNTKPTTSFCNTRNTRPRSDNKNKYYGAVAAWESLHLCVQSYLHATLNRPQLVNPLAALDQLTTSVHALLLLTPDNSKTVINFLNTAKVILHPV